MSESNSEPKPDGPVAEVAEADQPSAEAAGGQPPASDASAPAERPQEDLDPSQEAHQHPPPADEATRSHLLATAPVFAAPSPVSRTRARRGPPLIPALIAASALLGFWLLRRLRSRAEPTPSKRARSSTGPRSASRAGASSGPHRTAADSHDAVEAPSPSPPSPPPEPVDPDTLEILLYSPPVPDPATAATRPPGGGSLPLPLAGVTFLVSEDVDLEGLPTTLGRDPHDGTSLTPAGSSGSAASAAASASCSAVSRLQSSGAVCLGKAAMQPLGLDTLGANYGNPYNKSNVSGGGQTGCAAGVATGLAQLALASDLLGSARIPAACCGVYCYRSTPGVLGHASAAAAAAAAAASGTSTSTTTSTTTTTTTNSSGGSGSTGAAEGVESLSLMAADPWVMMRAAQALGVPGSFKLSGEIIRFVVAEDLFGVCAVEYQPAVLAIKRAILKWAGSEQAGAVQLCSFLSENSGGWQSLTPDELLSDLGGLPPGLAAWATAGRLLTAAHVNAKLSPSPSAPPPPADEEAADGPAAPAPAAAAAAAAAAPEDGPSGAEAEAAEAEQSPEVSEPAGGEEAEPREDASEPAAAESSESGAEAGASSLGAAAAAAAAVEAAAAAAEGAAQPRKAPAPPPPPPERLAAAREAARQLYDTLKHTVKPDTVIIMPVVPTAPLKRRAAAAADGGDGAAKLAPEALAWEALSQSFNCLAALAQCPVVVVPLGAVADGTPLAAALMGCGRFDGRLLAVAAKTGPLMQEAFESVKQGLADAVRKQNEQQLAAAAAAAAPPAAPATPAAGGRRGGGAAAAAAAPVTPPPVSHTAVAAAAAAPPPTPAVDPRRLDRAERFKGRGNELFKAGKFADAVGEYSKAINEHPDNPVYYNNRAMAYLKIFRFEQAEEDCNRALKFDVKDADKAKALLRRATARNALQKYDEAEKDLRQVLAVEPNNRQAREDLQNLQHMKADMAAAQQRMVADFQAQRRMAAGAAPGAPKPGAVDAALPPAFDPSSLPPGVDFSQLAAAAGGNEAALMGLMEAAAAAGGNPGGLPPGLAPPGFGGLADLGPMFGGGGGGGGKRR